MLLVGLTGGLGAGKSTVGGMLSDRGAVLVDADELAREALDPGTAAYKQVCDLFGDQVVTASGQLDREAIAAAVFDEPERRRSLESIVHPEVFRMLADIVEDRRGTEDIIVFDAPLIVETGFHDACDVVVVVTAQEEARVARAVGGRGMTVDEARARIRAQLGDAEREAVADVVIRNDGTLADLERQVDELWEQLRARGD
jgi:dephospho-CoA kinase